MVQDANWHIILSWLDKDITYYLLLFLPDALIKCACVDSLCYVEGVSVEFVLKRRYIILQVQLPIWCFCCLSVGQASECERLVYGSDGRHQRTFYSPLFPQVYPPRRDCVLYAFVGDPREIVELTILEFDLRLPVGNRWDCIALRSR